MLLRNQVFELVLQLTNLHVDACDLQVIGCVIRLLQGLLWHRGHHSINRHEEIILATAPLGKLVLCEARIERALGNEWLVLM